MFFGFEWNKPSNSCYVMIFCNPCDKVLAPRNVHRSVADGLILYAIQAVYVESENVLFLVSHADDSKDFKVAKASIKAVFEYL